jgi:hypothetical protein
MKSAGKRIFQEIGRSMDLDVVAKEKEREQEEKRKQSRPSLPPITEEQAAIIESLRGGNNVVVNSGPGCGKTTTVLHIVEAFPGAKITCLTYNTKLKEDTDKKAKEYGFSDQLDVDNFHSYAYRNYDKKITKDIPLDTFLKKVESFFSSSSSEIVSDVVTPCDIFIIDEVQDCTKLLYNLVCRIWLDLIPTRADLPKPLICVLGDERQCIYGFNGADARYLTQADVLFAFNEYPWRKHILSLSHRLTIPNADFINHVLLNGEQAVVSHKEGVRPIYWYLNPFEEKDIRLLVDMLGDYRRQGYEWSDILIVADSVRQRRRALLPKNERPLAKLERLLNKKRTSTDPHDACFHDLDILVLQDNDIDAKDKEGKLLIATRHKVKGGEAKIVIYFGFDDYYEGLKRASSRQTASNRCSNAHFVGVSRASEQLILIHGGKNAHFPFIDQAKLAEYCDIRGEFLSKEKKEEEETTTKVTIPYTVTQLITSLACVKEIEGLSLINYPHKENEEDDEEKKDMVENWEPIAVFPTIERLFDDKQENVSHITGQAVTLYFALMSGNKSRKQVQEMFNKVLKDERFKEIEKSKRAFLSLRGSEHNYCLSEIMNPFFDAARKKDGQINVAHLLYMTLCHEVAYDYTFAIHQIDRFDWLSEETLALYYSQATHLLNLNMTTARFEEPVQAKVMYNGAEFRLSGRLDCYDVFSDTVYEFKCVQELSSSFILQLAVYMYICWVNYDSNLCVANDAPFRRKFVLLNLNTGERVDISDTPFENLQRLVYLLIENKTNFDSAAPMTDAEFLESNLVIARKYGRRTSAAVGEEM